MRNPLLHLLFLAAPLLVAELGADASSHLARRTAPKIASASDAPACDAPAATRKPTPAPSTPTTPPPPSSNTATRTPRRPLPAHLFM